MIEVIPFVFEEDECDPITYRVLHRKGDVVVSHGVCHETLRNVVLPCEPFRPFVAEHCYESGGSYFLKD